MTSDLEVVVLDVGHGNCAVLRDGGRCAIIDVPKDSSEYDERSLYAELSRCGVSRIEHVVISHADADHAAGVTELLSDVRFTFGTLWFNTDASKNTRVWRDLCYQARLAYQQGRVSKVSPINSSAGNDLSFDRVAIRILHPDIEWAMRGPSNLKTEYGTLSSNRLSIVVHASLAGLPAVLLAADVDQAGVDRMIELGIDLAAPVLVFPHHGGSPNGNEAEFARKLVEAVKPHTIVFSIGGNGRFRNPNPQIVSGARLGAPGARIACTQLSVRCHAASTEVDGGHLNDRPAAARSRRRCCAGSVVVSWSNLGVTVSPDRVAHFNFVKDQLSSPLCISS